MSGEVTIEQSVVNGMPWERTFVDGVLFSEGPAPASAELQAKLAALGAAMLADPDRFAELVAQVANSNTAKGPLTYLKAAIEAGAEAGA